MNLLLGQSPNKILNAFLKSRRSTIFLSLRLKILIGFTVTLTLLFGGAFYWFYAFMTEKTLDRLRADMRTTLTGTAQKVNVEELLALYREGERNADGFSDDPRYLQQLEWFDTVHQAEPEMWFYTFVIDYVENNRRYGEPAVPPRHLEVIYLVDLWAKYDPSKASKFLEPDSPPLRGLSVIKQQRLIEYPKIYTDRWGTWLSAATPLFDDGGNVVAIIGLDVQADYVRQIQQEIQHKVLTTFGLTYGLLFSIIYISANLITRYIEALSKYAESIAQGNYEQFNAIARNSKFPDELDQLAQSFDMMSESIRIREVLIRESNRAEHEVQLALQRERELHELKSQFISLVSHEFRTPLTVIRTSTELLENYVHKEDASKRRNYFQRIRTSIKNISNLIDNILTIGQAEAGKLQINPIPVNLYEVCIDTIHEIQTNINSKDRIQFSSNQTCIETVLDPKLLRSILFNLLSNAIKYSSASSIVQFTLTGVCREAVLEVQDYGIGIPQDDQAQLFELFHRGHNVSNIGGTGLGLAITKQCVELLQGEITFSSEEKVGTRFIVKIPIPEVCTLSEELP